MSPPGIVQQLALHQLHSIYLELDDVILFGFEIDTKKLYLNPLQKCPQLYDLAIYLGHVMNNTAEEKKVMWAASLAALKKDHRKAKWTIELLKKEREELYKSIIVRKYLLDRYLETGEKMDVFNEKGERVKRMDFGILKFK